MDFYPREMKMSNRLVDSSIIHKGPQVETTVVTMEYYSAIKSNKLQGTWVNFTKIMLNKWNFIQKTKYFEIPFL